MTLYSYNNNYYGTNKIYLDRLDETGICFLSDMGYSISDMKEICQNKICDILSLQANGLYLGENGRWKMKGKSKQAGHLRIEKYKNNN